MMEIWRPIRLVALILATLAGLTPCGAATQQAATQQPVVMGKIAAQPAFWTVRSPTATAYLLGSVHILPPNIDWHTPAIDAALNAADTFVFEAPLGDDGKQEAQDFVRAHGLLPLDTALPSLLDESQRQDYQNAIAHSSLPPETLAHVRPWLAAMMLEGSIMHQMHYSSDSGVDRQLFSYAREHNRQIQSFETITQQMQLLMPADPKLEIEEFDVSLRELNKDRREIGALVDAWTHGDLPGLEKLLNGDLDRAPTTRKLLLDDRNARWIPQIAAMLATHHTYFITVGTGHLLGPHGVPALLAARGYRVEGPPLAGPSHALQESNGSGAPARALVRHHG